MQMLIRIEKAGVMASVDGELTALWAPRAVELNRHVGRLPLQALKLAERPTAGLGQSMHAR